MMDNAYTHSSGEQFSVRTLTVGGKKTLISDQQFPVRESHVARMEKTLAMWQAAFPYEPTWVSQNFGVPSLFVRVECVIDGEDVKYFEIEERPNGMGLFREFVPGFRERLDELQRQWPEFGYVASPSRGVTEDSLWLETVNGDRNRLVVVRAEPHEKYFHQYQERSVSTVINEGNKSYGVRLGWWNEVEARELEFEGDIERVLPFSSGFALKPFRGSKCLDVHFHFPFGRLKSGEQRQGVERILAESCSSKQQIESVLRRRKWMYCQPFIMPMLSGIPGYNLMIYRLMFGWSPNENKWKYIGGCWNGRDSLRIHGAEDTLFGPVTLES